MDDTPVIEPQAAPASQRRNYTVMASCGVFVACMVGMSFAAVPLYDLYCKVTGYNGTTQKVEQASEVILDQKIRVELDSNVSSDLNWDFRPVDRVTELRIGETAKVNFRVTNNSTREKTGRSVFNVTPMVAGAYFNKLECFCFTDVTLKPGETRDMPVVFFVDPDIVNYPETKDLKVLTLSYTFYGSDKAKPVAEVKDESEGAPKKL
ncbi:cytochrome c oxidase assembly protein [Rhizobium sp. KVB221]|uniref:Cytochrome c oxidase assembly protein CtaG n=1 Tax=Rhizobium setariae TaxID=2801340 RepID=A0A936YQQ5_9HYPH|nr:cytochrome c oxidase assembly protein [Rhizobium setariae]MBL0370827.1 cytochrome c oxidase assembly protein [Rhizobium setariae]